MKLNFLDLPDEPGTTYKSFTRETLDDAKVVVRASFGDDAVSLLEKILKNPMLVEFPNADAGDLVYAEGVPVGFEAVLLRRLYWGQRPLLATIGSTMGLRPGTSPMALLSLMKRNLAPRRGSALWFANTANATSVKMNRKMGVRGRGPATWETFAYAVIRPLAFLTMVFRRKVLKRYAAQSAQVALPVREEVVLRSAKGLVCRLCTVDVKNFDAFWQKYLAGNTGFVSSRTARELQWFFGDRLVRGGDVLLGSFEGDNLAGYVVLRACTDGWWQIADLIALGNSPGILENLLRAAKRFLRKRTKAVLLQARGFPMFARPTLERQLPKRRSVGSNTFLWQVTDECLAGELGDLTNAADGWFFGPYDGDWCL